MAKKGGYHNVVDRIRHLPENEREGAIEVMTFLWDMDRMATLFIFCTVAGGMIVIICAGTLAWTMGLFAAPALTVLARLLALAAGSCLVSGLAFWLSLFGQERQSEREKLRELIDSDPRAARAYEWIERCNLSL